MDFAQAFDNLDHQILFSKLRNNDRMPVHILYAIQNLYNSAHWCPILHQRAEELEFIKVKKGVL